MIDWKNLRYSILHTKGRKTFFRHRERIFCPRHSVLYPRVENSLEGRKTSSARRFVIYFSVFCAEKYALSAAFWSRESNFRDSAENADFRPEGWKYAFLGLCRKFDFRHRKRCRKWVFSARDTEKQISQNYCTFETKTW